jgi:hypothetical protein
LSQALVAKCIEIVPSDVDDVASLKAAVQEVDVVFATTAFNHAIVRVSPSDLDNPSPGQTLREWCYELEVHQGRNIADAVATVEGLEVFILCGLSDAGSGVEGKYRGVLHFDSKTHVADPIYGESLKSYFKS